MDCGLRRKIRVLPFASPVLVRYFPARFAGDLIQPADEGSAPVLCVPNKSFGVLRGEMTCSAFAKQIRTHSSKRFLQRQCFYALDARLSMRKFLMIFAESGIQQTMKNPFTYTIKLVARFEGAKGWCPSGNRFPDCRRRSGPDRTAVRV